MTPERPPLPTGLRRVLFRLPLRLYHLRLGWLLGSRFLALHHRGRRSGQWREVVLEVVTREGPHGPWYLASGFGTGAAWYRNLQADPGARIQVGRRRFAVTAEFLDADEGGDLMARYASVHPKVARRLCAFMGFTVDGSREQFRQAGEQIPFVRLVDRAAELR